MSTSQEVSMRRFVLVRSEDVSGTSGTGVVAEGIEFSNGQVVIHWLTQLESVAIYANVKVLDQVHGHGGRTRVEWVDPAVRLRHVEKPTSKEIVKKMADELSGKPCSKCRGKGWYETGNNDLICDCSAGSNFVYSHGTHGTIIGKENRLW
jgi:hypothetical protein